MNNKTKKERLFESLNVATELNKMGFKESSLDEFLSEESYEPRIVAFYNDNAYTIDQSDFNKHQKTFNELKKKMSNVLMVKQNISDDEFTVTIEQNQNALNKYDNYKTVNKLQNTSETKIKRSTRAVDLEKESDPTIHINIKNNAEKINDGEKRLKNPDHLSKEIRSRRGLGKR